MDYQPDTSNTATNNLGMDFGWHPDVYSERLGHDQCAIDAANAITQPISGDQDEDSE